MKKTQQEVNTPVFQSQISHDLVMAVLAFCCTSIFSSEEDIPSLPTSKYWHKEKVEGHMKDTLKIK